MLCIYIYIYMHIYIYICILLGVKHRQDHDGRDDNNDNYKNEIKNNAYNIGPGATRPGPGPCFLFWDRCCARSYVTSSCRSDPRHNVIEQ